MKKLIAGALFVALLAALLSGCGGGGKQKESGAKGASSSAPVEESALPEDNVEETHEGGTTSGGGLSGYPVADSYASYINAKSAMTTKLSDGLSSNPDTALASLGLLGVVMVDMVMLPASLFGMGKQAVASGLGFLGATDVDYIEDGDSYIVRYTDSEGKTCEFEGTYNKSADSLVCKATSDGEDSLYAEYYKTDFGYIGQYYSVNDDGTVSVFMVTVQGEDGIIGISNEGQYSPLTGKEKFDHPKNCEEWYAVSGNTITGKMSDGREINFEISEGD